METRRQRQPRLRALVERRLKADPTERARILINFAAMLFLPFTSFLLLELMVQGAPAVAPNLQGLNYVLYAGLLLLLTAITRRLRTSARVYTVLIWALATAEYVVLAYRSSPILPADLRSLGTAANVASHYSFPFSWRYLLVTAGFALQFFGCRHLTWRLNRKLTSVVATGLAAAMMTAVILPVTHPWSRYKLGVNTATHQPVQMAAENGFVLNFVHSFYEREVEKPERYSLERVQALADSYEQMLGAPEIDRIMRSAMLSTARGYLARPLSDAVPSETTSRAANTRPSGTPSVLPTAAARAVTDPGLSFWQPYPGPGYFYVKDLMQAKPPELGAHDYMDFSYLDVPTEDPTRYHDAAVDAVLRRLNRDTGRTKDPEIKPDIIVIMNESFSDLQRLRAHETNLDILPVYEGLTTNARKGDAHVSVIGGNTANSEFEFLTGATLAFLPTGTIAYQQYIEEDTPTLVSLLEAQGYRTAALHPYYADGWERETVYPMLGFDEMRFIEDFVHQETVRDYISDASVYREIEDILDRDDRADRDDRDNRGADDDDDRDAADADPRFIFAVTMQNHGAYGDIFENFRDDVHITDRESTPALDQYLSLIRESDRMLGEFLVRLQRRERPTVVLFFGDHQPNDNTVEPLMLDEAGEPLDPVDEAVRRRITPYLLWTNYAPHTGEDEGEGEATAAYGAPEHSSLNYLALDLLDAADLKLCPWQAFLRDVRRDFPVINDAFYCDAEGTPHLFADGDEAALPEALQDYEILQYNYLFDLEHRVDRLFEPYR